MSGFHGESVSCEENRSNLYSRLLVGRRLRLPQTKQDAALSREQTDVKRTISLTVALATCWLLWSGHLLDHPFLLLLGATSVASVVWIAIRMEITDEEGAPINMGLRPLSYAVWLAKEIVEANIEVARVILSRKLSVRPRMIRVKASQESEIGRVILANSITLTPGTVSVDMQGDRIWVHALSFEGAEEDLSGDMDRRVCALEKQC